MKSIINRLFFCCVIAVIPFQLSAARMFILFNEDCMERLEYKSVNRNVDPFVAYQINVGDGEKVILEIGQESRNTTSKLPTPTVGCDNGVFNLSMVQKINAHIDEVFLVVKKNNRRYTVSPVNFATHFQVQDNTISVFSPKYKFEFNTKEGAIGENISREPTADVFFEGRLEQECTGAYVFRQIAQGSRTPYTDLVLIPEVGIIEMRSGQTLDQALANGMQLSTVNDEKFDDYLEEKCEESLSDNVLANAKPGQAREAEVTPTGPVGYDMTVKQGSVRPRDTNTPNRVNTTPTSIPQPANQVGGTNQYHIVKKGETLYRISKQYNISVGQIKSWNNLNSNLIRTGSQLMVGTVAASSQNTTAKSGTIGTPIPNNANTVANTTTTNRPQYFPAPYGTSYRPNEVGAANATNEVMTARGGTQETYIVRPGDTVASLAMRFGFTESKFRTMNNLGNNDYVKIGQELKINDCNCPPVTSTSAPMMEDTPQEFNFVQREKGIQEENSFNTPTPAANTSVTNPRGYPVNFNDTPIQTTSSTPIIPRDDEAYRNSTRSPSPLYSPRESQTTNTSNSLLETEQGSRGASRQPSPYDAIIPNSFDTYSPITAGEKDQANRGINFSKPAANRRQHVVQDGENIFQIARMYNMTTERLRALNGLELGEVILPTQKLYVE